MPDLSSSFFRANNETVALNAQPSEIRGYDAADRLEVKREELSSHESCHEMTPDIRQRDIGLNRDSDKTTTQLDNTSAKAQLKFPLKPDQISSESTRITRFPKLTSFHQFTMGCASCWPFFVRGLRVAHGLLLERSNVNLQ